MNYKDHSLPAGCAYRIVKRLGSGGEGTVYLVCHLPTEQFRAAKLFTDISRDWRHELDMLKRLHHPALPQVIDVLEQPGQFWLIMEYIEGQPLEQLACRLDDEELFQIAEQLSGVLQYLHSRKEPVYHLDLKPSNILIRADGRLALIDFGVAIRGRPGGGSCSRKNERTDIAADTHLTGLKEKNVLCQEVPENAGKLSAESFPAEVQAVGEAAPRYGTKGFAAPEQMTEGAEVDGRADLFGFGAVIYYCRYGAVPDIGAKKIAGPSGKFPAPVRNLISKTFQNTHFFSFTSPKHKTKGSGRALPHGLDRIVQKCLRPVPEDRFADTVQMQKELRRAKKRYQRRKQPGQIAAAGVLLVGVLAFFRAMGGAENDPAYTAGIQDESSEPDADTQNQRYYLLLDMAEGLGFSQAEECFEEAASLNPGEESWYLGVLDWVQADSLFDEKEEETVRTLWFAADEAGVTRLDHLKENPEAYGRIAWRLGLAYWYFYSGQGGKSAAARWFEQAVSVLENGEIQADWEQDARLHAQISSYYGMLGRTDEEEEREQKEWEYWKDMKALWNMKTAERDSRINWKIEEELLNRMVMDTAFLYEHGETKEALEELLISLGSVLYEPEQAENEDEKDVLMRLRELCRDAEAALARTFCGL